MSIMPKNLPNYTRTTYVVKASEPINEDLEVNEEIWYNGGWSFSNDDDRYIIRFFAIKYPSSAETVKEKEAKIEYIKCYLPTQCDHLLRGKYCLDSCKIEGCARVDSSSSKVKEDKA